MLGGFPSGMYVDYAISTGKTTVPGVSLFYPALVYLKSVSFIKRCFYVLLFLVISSYISWLRLFLFGWLVAVGFCCWGKLKGGVHVHAHTHTQPLPFTFWVVEVLQFAKASCFLIFHSVDH